MEVNYKDLTDEDIIMLGKIIELNLNVEKDLYVSWPKKTEIEFRASKPKDVEDFEKYKKEKIENWLKKICKLTDKLDYKLKGQDKVTFIIRKKKADETVSQ